MSSHHEPAPPEPVPFPVPDVPGQPVTEVDWFRRVPTGGGTVYARPTD
ncbi:hypothetical protein [Lentzea xinjiangensis]|nr:hypothetical protein [Lentzea xinjiangensis]